MATSPRKPSSSTFNPTWHETDASFLDPTSLPLSKAPRAWERKTQVTVSRDGKQKKIFRRYTLRSRPANTQDPEEDNEEEQDSRFRAVKKLQRMSPDAMEKNATRSKGKRRTFKATRWDRRKSILPRKKTAPQDTFLPDMDESIDADDENTLDSVEVSNDSASERDIFGEEEAAPAPESLVEGEKRRSTFSFTYDGQHDDLADQGHANLPEPHEDSLLTPSESGAEQDGTLKFIFRSPSKAASPTKSIQFAENTNTSPSVERDATMQLLFRSPSRRASPAKRCQLADVITPSPGMEQDGAMQLLFRSPSNRTSLTKRVQFAEKTNPSPGPEQDATIHLLFRSPSKDVSPNKRISFAVDADRSPLSQADEIRSVDSNMSEMVEEEETVTLEGDSETPVLCRTMAGVEELEDSILQEREEEKLAISDQSDLEQDVEVPMIAMIDVPQLVVDEHVPLVVSYSPPQLDKGEDTEMTEITFDLHDVFSRDKPSTINEAESEAVAESPGQENALIEASLQLDIQRDVEMALEGVKPETSVLPEEHRHSMMEEDIADEENINRSVITSPGPENEAQELQSVLHIPVVHALDNIADGLTLDISASIAVQPPPHRLRSLSPPPQEPGPDDITMTIALDDDTAILKDFLTRAAASKANKVTTIARRSSLINRRDSDAIRHALASPRKILEDKDTNSPSKYDNDVTLDLTQTLTLNTDQQPPLSPTPDQADAEDTGGAKSSRSSRRSSRTRKSRLPAPSSAPQPTQGPTNISVRRVDGTEPIILKRTEAQELGLLTRANTRKNKQGAFAVSVKLFHLNTEGSKLTTETAALQGARDDSKKSPTDAISGKKSVRWDETLEYFQEGTDTQANIKADAESLATPDELSLPVSSSSSKSKIKVTKDKTSTPKVRRIRGLGAANGTPGKGLLGPSSMLPDDVVDEKGVPAPDSSLQRLPKPKASRVKKMPVDSSSADKAPSSSISSSVAALPPPEVAPVVERTKDFKAAKERKSRLATPKRIQVSNSVSAIAVVDGKENQQSRGLTAATPKKGITIPQVIVPPAPVVETGLPRRRARKM
ncbi:hypothetical protein K505DRAFT_414333 [Melanomma pulvis-pyrius CBS 109.77]|uniref:Uncharacterized protein n=1 Tax=Melanomma pulvis-pyrius CBS 109.77 TaxID=1314802 RepID=A0A6A6XQ19_9PLEO|nr:hypothetical protein K505DRAFT_414333 [Melanomma pulvis-pyrius CBS 109.77]